MRYHVIISCMEWIASYDCQADSEAEAIEKAKAAIGEKDWEWYGGNWNAPIVVNVDDPEHQERLANKWEDGYLYKSVGYLSTSSF